MSSGTDGCGYALIDDDFIAMIEDQAAHFRKVYKLEADALITVELPHPHAVEAVRRWGSLPAASDVRRSHRAVRRQGDQRMTNLGPTLKHPRYHARIETNSGDGTGPQTEHTEGADPRVVAAWLRAQADRLDPPRRPGLRGMTPSLSQEAMRLSLERGLSDATREDQ